MVVGRHAVATARRTNDPKLDVWASFRLGRVMRMLGDMKEAADLFHYGIALAQQHQLRYLEGQCLRALAFLLNELRQNQDGKRYSTEALVIAREMGDRVSESWALIVLGESELGLGDDKRANQHLEQGNRICCETGDRWGESWSMRLLGSTAYHQYDWLTARSWFEQSVALTTSIGDFSNQMPLWIHLGGLYLMLGDLENSHIAYDRVITFSEQTGHKLIRIYGLWGKALIYLAEEKPHEAMSYIQKGIAQSEEFGAPSLVGGLSVLLGQGYLKLGDISAAYVAFTRAVELLKNGEHSESGIEAEAGLIRIALAEGDLQDARQRVDEILHVFAQTDKPKLMVELGDLSEIYFVCYETLRLTNDARAAQVFAEAQIYLATLVEHVPDAATCAQMFNNLPNRRELWRVLQAGMHSPSTSTASQSNTASA